MTATLTMDGHLTSRIYEQIVVFGECYTCGLPVAMTRFQRREYEETGATMWCSQGHQTVRTKSDLQKLKEQLREAQDQTARAETATRNAEAMLEAVQQKTKRLEKRVRAGVCPDCHRTFVNVQRHRASKHPGG